jgi:hypothetical protein
MNASECRKILLCDQVAATLLQLSGIFRDGVILQMQIAFSESFRIILATPPLCEGRLIRLTCAALYCNLALKMRIWSW